MTTAGYNVCGSVTFTDLRPHFLHSLYTVMTTKNKATTKKYC